MTKYYSRSKQKFVDIEQMPDQYVRNAFVKMCKHEPTEDVIFAQQQKERADKYKKLAEDNFISGVDDLGEIEFLRYHNKVDIETINKNIDTMSNMADQITKLKKQLNSTTYQPYDKQGRVRDYQVEFTKLSRERDKWKEKSMNMIEKSTHTELEMENVRLVAQLEHDEHNVGKLDNTVSKDTYQVMWDNCQVLQNERAKLLKESNELKDEMQTYRDRNAVLSRMYNASLSSNAILGDVKMFSEIPNDPDGQEFVSQLKKYLNNVSYKIRVRGQYLDEETKRIEGWRKYEMGQPIEKSKCLRVYVDTKKEVD
jgi:FtsZ-binding cell division protein ZapB